MYDFKIDPVIEREPMEVTQHRCDVIPLPLSCQEAGSEPILD